MKPFAVFARLLIGGSLLATALGSAALSLGATSGQVLIGRPLNVSIPVVLDQPDQISNLCLNVQVFFADRRLPSGAVATSVKPGKASRDAVVQVRVSEVVNEPIVSLELALGCSPTITRRYVLLADVAGNELRSEAISFPALAQQLQGSVSGAAVLRPERRVNGAATPQSTRTRPPAVAPETKPRSASTARGSKPRLTLVPADFAFDRSPALRPSGQLETPVAGGSDQRAAAAALWRAMNLSPDDVLKNTERLALLETELARARLSSLQSQRAVSELRSELATAQGARYANGLVYGLGAICAALLALLVWLWRKPGRADASGTEWWRRRVPVSVVGVADKGAAGHVAALPRGVAASKPPSDPLPDSALDLDLVIPAASSVRKNAPVRDFLNSNLSERMDFSSNLPGGARAVNVEELFDVQQQADFFVSLGQHEQAVRVLRTHIGDNAETSALAYLDLFKLYHSLGDTRNYDALRVDFNQAFNARVPEFSDYQGDGQGLEAYPQALARIQALWPAPEVLGVIEQSVFKRPDDDAELFNLHAYRELLLLHAMAKELVAAVPSEDVLISPPAEFPDHGSGQDRLDIDFSELQAQASRDATATRANQPAVDEPAMDAGLTSSGNLIDFDDFDLPDLTKPDASNDKPR